MIDGEELGMLKILHSCSRPCSLEKQSPFKVGQDAGLEGIQCLSYPRQRAEVQASLPEAPDGNGTPA